MDPKLAEIYGTNQPTESDLEKLAAAELAEGLANEDQIDTDGLSEDDLEAIAQDVLGSNEDSGEGADEGSEDGQEKISSDETSDESKEKLAEADYLGRVMAHAYVNELREIEKVAGGIADQGVATPQTKMEKLREMGGKAGGKVMGAAGKVGEKASFGKLTGGKAQALGGALALGGAAAGAYGAKKIHDKFKSKKSSAEAPVVEAPEYSAVDTLVLARAQEILEASGIDPNGLEKQSFALTEEGHKLDAKRYGAIAKANHEAAGAEDDYAKDAPVKANLFRPGQGALHRMHSRHADYAAAKHEKGQNALNPFGGLGGKSRLEKKSADAGTDPREFLANEVEQRAWNLLGEYGVVPSEEPAEK